MIATLQFSLPEEREEFKEAFNGALWKYAMQELDEWIRREHKNGNEVNGDQVREKIREILEDHELFF